MSENYLMLNGKRIDLTDEQVKTLTVEEKKSPFERKQSVSYYFIDGKAKLGGHVENNDLVDDSYFAVANYCTDKAMMERRALHEILNRLLWRYSEEHGGDNEWDCGDEHWFIYKNSDESEPSADFSCLSNHQGIVYFKDKETAQSAIEEIVKPFMKEHPKFVW